MAFPEIGFVRLPQIIGDRKRGIPAVIPVSEATRWRGVKSGKYPAGILLGPRTRAIEPSQRAERNRPLYVGLQLYERGPRCRLPRGRRQLRVLQQGKISRQSRCDSRARWLRR